MASTVCVLGPLLDVTLTISRAARFDSLAKTILHKTNISYFCAVVMPDADAVDVRCLFDWVC